MTTAASPQSDRPRQLRRQARLFRIVNVPMRRILGLPFRTPLSKNLMLVHLTGRRTGKSYRQPVSYVRDGDTLLTPGGRELEAEPRARPAGDDPAGRT